MDTINTILLYAAWAIAVCRAAQLALAGLKPIAALTPWTGDDTFITNAITVLGSLADAIAAGLSGAKETVAKLRAVIPGQGGGTP